MTLFPTQTGQTRRGVIAASAATGLLAAGGAARAADDEAIRPFRANVPQAAIDDLRRRFGADVVEQGLVFTPKPKAAPAKPGREAHGDPDEDVGDVES